MKHKTLKDFNYNWPEYKKYLDQYKVLSNNLKEKKNPKPKQGAFNNWHEKD